MYTDFLKNNMQWRMKPISEEKILAFYQLRKKVNIQVIAHASYLINLAASCKDKRKNL